jgi:hypothetical protein
MHGREDRSPFDDHPSDTVDDDDALLGPQAPPQRMHGDIPIRGYLRGEPIPDLSVLPQERWREVLTPLSPSTRQFAKATVGSIPDAMAVNALVGELIVSAPPPSLAAAPPPMPRSVADPPARGSRHQVNFRLSADEHARLTHVARAFGMRPGPLARLLTVRGVQRALYEERRDG